jgi:hypothetical protein
VQVQNGKPDHKAAVADELRKAKGTYPKEDGYTIDQNRSIKNDVPGLDRRPDIVIRRYGRIDTIIEVARTNKSGSLVAREQRKLMQYVQAGLKSIFRLLGRR